LKINGLPARLEPRLAPPRAVAQKMRNFVANYTEKRG
jgi:hypothetical protein